ncbi:uncharacterized protein LOC130647588 [Hydractinia symbiolongicarpus]|uniref:uncharacterized protein LOC130647588 n=1 Tax=Hydractinia symbiolongicarpus TaxID=13093 RepID=UPI00254ADCF5|nr:uncharacterized protein LOC130647588 [Hydractinia symbiolongicarpus]
MKGLEAGNPSHKLASIVYNIISRKLSLLPNSKVIVCGRPQAFNKIEGIFLQSRALKLIEVSGFNRTNIAIYIVNFFNGNKEKIQSLYTSLSEIKSLETMCHIPVYLHTICNVYASEQKLTELNTMTKLNIAACLVFLRDHMTEFKGKNYTLAKISQDKKVLKMIIETSKFAFRSLQEKRIYFTQDEFEFENGDCLKEIEQSGIIVKVEGNEDGDFFQFKHLILQEFLCAVYIFHCALDALSCSLWNMNNCLPLVAELHGIIANTYCGPNYLKQFVRNIKEPSNYKPVEYLFEYMDKELFLEAFYEYHGDVSDAVKKYFFNKNSRHSDNVFMNIYFHHTLTHLIFFLKTIKKPISTKLEILLATKDRQITSSEMSDLSQFFFSPYITIESLQFSETLVKARDMLCLFQSDCIAPKTTHNSPISNAQTVNADTFTLKFLHLGSCNISDDHIKALQPCIPSLEFLHIRENFGNLTPTSMTYISESILRAVKVNTNKLEVLYLSDCSVGDDHIKQLQPCIPCLKGFLIDENFHVPPLTPISMKYISESIIRAVKQNANNLETLDLKWCDLGIDHINQLLPCITALKDLNISGNLVSARNISECILHAVKNNTNKLENLRLSDCNLDDDGIYQLQPCITHLKSLHISDNCNMTIKSMKNLLESIKKASKENTNKLEKLYLSSCCLNSENILELQLCTTSDIAITDERTMPISVTCNSDSTVQAGEENTKIILRSCGH